MQEQDGSDDAMFETNQTVVAAFLVHCGHEIVTTIWDDGMCTFTFEHTEDLSRDFGTFVRGKASVEPASFNNTFGQVMRRLKESRAEEKRRLGVPESQRLEDATTCGG